MTNIQIEISIATLILLILIFFSLRKNTMSIKNSIAWLLLPLVFIIIAIFPKPLETFANWLGFETLANFIFVVIIALLLIICFFITLSNSHQQEQITKLNQELSILKAKKLSKKSSHKESSSPKKQ